MIIISSKKRNNFLKPKEKEKKIFLICPSIGDHEIILNF